MQCSIDEDGAVVKQRSRPMDEDAVMPPNIHRSARAVHARRYLCIALHLHS